MAYFLESHIKFLDQLLHLDEHQHWFIDHIPKPQIESLSEKSIFLRDYLENCAAASEESMENLEDKIRDAVQSAEESIESHITIRIHSGRSLRNRWGGKIKIPPLDLEKVIEEFDTTKEEMMKIVDGAQILYGEPSAASFRSDPNPRKIFVGFEKDLSKLKDRVTSSSSKLEVIPIVGMGGMGKTTLARNVYEDPSVVSSFDVLAWTTISQDYSVREMFLGLLRCVVGRHTDELLQERDNQLKLILHKELTGKRYLIVLDDIWDSKAWDSVKAFFPKGHNESRIILTTRESIVANYVDPKSSHHQMHLLDDDDSWELLRRKVYGEETCPPALEKFGIKIAKSCRGLPLALHVVGGLLSHAPRTKASWEKVATDVSSTDMKDEQITSILSLSYNHLPPHLKPCFLYMSTFPEDYEIRASKLIMSWVTEGFLRPIKYKSQEEAAEVYLKALVDRNLIFVREQEINGKVKSFGVHDLLRDMCVRKAREKKFLDLFAKSRPTPKNQEDMPRLPRVSVHNGSYRIRDLLGSAEQMSLARSFQCIGKASCRILSPVFLALRFLRELNVLEIEFPHFPDEILHNLHLRYLALTCGSNIPESITSLWNLQTLVVRLASVQNSTPIVTDEIFNMPQLRYINIKSFGKAPWYTFAHPKTYVLQENLHSLSILEISQFPNKIFKTIPNLKKLRISCYSSKTLSADLTCLLKLETLKCSADLSPKSDTFLPKLIFPSSLKKLTLSKCRIPQTCMDVIGLLHNLEILKLRNNILENPNWEPSEGEYNKLQFLLLESLNLVNWTADQNNFPRLRHLIILDCPALEEIPEDVGNIPTLEVIEVNESSPSVATSARKILEDQQLNYGNEQLQLRTCDSSQYQLSRPRERQNYDRSLEVLHVYMNITRGT